MGITCSKNELLACSCFLFVLRIDLHGDSRKKVLYPSLLFGKEKFRRDGRKAKKRKGRRVKA